MRRLRRASAVAAAAAAFAGLQGCATPAREGLVWIVVGGEVSCAVEVEERRFGLPADAAGLKTHLAALAKRSEGAVVDSGPGRPSFECWSAALRIVGKAGFSRLGFVSDPPKPRDTQAA